MSQETIDKTIEYLRDKECINSNCVDGLIKNKDGDPFLDTFCLNCQEVVELIGELEKLKIEFAKMCNWVDPTDPEYKWKQLGGSW
jgi:hypothetical protein